MSGEGGAINSAIEVEVRRDDFGGFQKEACGRASMGNVDSRGDPWVFELRVEPGEFRSACGLPWQEPDEGSMTWQHACFIPTRVMEDGSVQGYLNGGPDVRLTFDEGAEFAVMHVIAPKPADREYVSYATNRIL